jgi:hypothetical protein
MMRMVSVLITAAFRFGFFLDECSFRAECESRVPRALAVGTSCGQRSGALSPPLDGAS